MYTIKPIVEVENYLNGQFVSSTVTVLNNNVTAEIENGKIKFGAFVQDGSFAPSLVEIVIQKYTMQEVTITPESGEPETKTVKVPVDGAIIDYTGVNAIPFDNYNAGYIIDLNDFENMQEDGLYYVTVQFIGNGNNVVDSLKYKKTNFEKRTTTVFGMQNGALTLGEAVANVTDYSVKIVNANEDVVATFNFTPDSTKTLPAELKDNGKTVTGFEAFVEGEDVIAENTLYTIYVKANGGASALDGKWSTGFKFMRLPAPKNVRLDKENVVYGSDTSIIWDSYSYNATGFEIKFKDEMTSMYQAEGSTVITKWELKPDKPEGVYNLQLRAIGNTTSSAVGMLTSYYSAISSDATVSYIRNDTNPTSANGIVTWQDLSTSGVVGYKVKGENQATGQNFEKYVTATSLNVVNSAEDITENGIVNSIVNFTDGGIWILSVEAVTDRTAVVTNIDAENHDKFASIYKPFAPSNYKILNGMLAWEYSVENLKNYISWLIPTGTPTTTDVVKYVYDAVNLGSNTTSLGVNLSFMYSLKLNINGVSTEDKPTSVVALDSTGAQIIDESAFGTAKTLRFIYDVAMQTDFSADGEAGSTVTNTAGIEYKAGYYKIAVSLASTHNVDGEIVYTDIVNSAYSGIIEAYKPNTPESWFDKASTEDDLNGGMEVQEESGDGEDDNSDITDDGAGEEETKPADTYIDILNGKALWELSVINDEFTNSSGDAIPGISYYKDYTLTARSVQNETSASVNITISSDDENISDKYKYSRDIKEIFYNENAQGENDKYLVKLNEAYKLYVYARGTADSALLDSNAPKFLNSNVYEFSNQINILDIQNPMVDESTLVMPKGYGSLSTNAYIYGPLNKEYELVINTDENGIKTEVIRAKTNSENTQEDWMSSAKSIELLAKIRYANSNITNDFTYWEVTQR